jgi:hypothetical protein
MSEADQGGVRRRAISLSTRQRWASGVVGGAAGGGGAVATFITSNQAGATALMLGGALGLLMSLTGRVPDRIGKEGVVHEAVDEAPARALERALTGTELDPDDKLKLAEIVQEEVATENLSRFTENLSRLVRADLWPSTESPAVTGVAVRAASEALIYEDRVKHAVRSVLPQGSRLEQPTLDSGVVFVIAVDFVIAPDEDYPAPEKSVAVAMHTQIPSPVEWQALASRNAQIYGAILLVVPRGRVMHGMPVPSKVRLVEFGTFKDNGVFAVGPRDRDALRAALTEEWSRLNPEPEQPEQIPWDAERP